MKSEKQSSDPIELLSMFQSGIMTVEIDGFPVLKVDGKDRNLDLEAQGLRKCGLKLTKLVQSETGKKGIRGIISASGLTARKLSQEGWSLNLFDRGSRILRMGRGVSRLTGHVEVNPLKIRNLLENI
jgi:hypothetical protein